MVGLVGDVAVVSASPCTPPVPVPVALLTLMSFDGRSLRDVDVGFSGAGRGGDVAMGVSVRLNCCNNDNGTVKEICIAPFFHIYTRRLVVVVVVGGGGG